MPDALPIAVVGVPFGTFVDDAQLGRAGRNYAQAEGLNAFEFFSGTCRGRPHGRREPGAEPN
jgi:hypothetical protein